MSIMELGALGEFFGVFALVATLIYLSIQVRHAKNESVNAVREARATGVRELSMGIATSDGLSAAMTKAIEATSSPHRFEAEMMSRGLDLQEAHRVFRFFLAQWRLHLTQYQTTEGAQRSAHDGVLRIVYSNGPGRLFWDNIQGQTESPSFIEHVNRLIAEADQKLRQ